MLLYALNVNSIGLDRHPEVEVGSNDVAQFMSGGGCLIRIGI